MWEFELATAAFGLVHTPGYTAPEPTLMRKHMETEVAAPANAPKARKMAKRVLTWGTRRARILAAKIADHALIVGELIYNLNPQDPHEQAAATMAYIDAFVGPPHPLPVDASRTASVVLDEFQRFASRRAEEAAAQRTKPFAQCADDI